MQMLENLLLQASEAALRYYRERDARDVVPTRAALNALRGLHRALPDEESDGHATITELDSLGSPATVATTGGRFFGFVVGGALPVTVAAGWLATAWDQNAGSYVLSPISAELEDVAAGWLLEILDLPREATVGFVTGSTMGTFSAIAAARSALLRRAGYDVKRAGLRGAPSVRIVVGAELHPTNLAALGYAGFGSEEITRVPDDAQGRIDHSQLPELDDRTIVILQAGNINSGAFDRFDLICERARRAGAWVHVDGAFGLWARASRRYRHLTEGIEQADSWSVDGHKWLNIPHDNAIYACRDASAIRDVFGVDASYLMRDERRQPNALTPELSRRSRGVEFWAALRTLGRRGVERLVDSRCAHAQRFADGLLEAGYEVLNDVVLNQVVFRLGTDDATNDALSMIQTSGRTWAGPTRWRGRPAIRISVSSWATTTHDVDESLNVMATAAKAHSRRSSSGS